MLLSVTRAAVAALKTASRVALPALFLGVSIPAVAQFEASGSITSSQRWQITDSPVRVTDDVVIENGAVLTIDPGVRVEVAADASVTVRNGALYAVGTPSSRIVITSARVPAQAQPGDWGPLRFENGTLDAQSALDYAIVEYGSGLTIESASPTLRNLTIRHHAAPAISLDTRSSPMGEGLVANGNTLDGILVAAGVVTGDVVWGLRGIPYVVRSGTVEVGALGFGLVPERLRLVEGVQGRLEVNLPEAAPPGGTSVTIASSVPSVVTAPASVVIAAGATRADVQITAITPGSAVVTASGQGFEPARADIEVLPRPTLQAPVSLTLNPAQSQRVTLNLSERAPDAGLQIAINNSLSSVVEAPALIQVPPRARSVQMDVRALVAGGSTLTLSAPGWASAVTNVVVRGRTLVLPDEIFVRPGRSTSSSVSVAQPVEGSALVVTLAADQPGVLVLPATVTIPVGQTTATFTAEGLSSGSVTVTASAAAYDTASTVARVERLELAWDLPSTYDYPTGAVIGYTPRNFPNAGRLRLNRPAPAGGVRVRLRAIDAGSVSFPVSEITIPAGRSEPSSLVRFRGEAIALTEVVAESDEADEVRQRLRVGPEATLRINNGSPTFTLGRGMAARPNVALESDGRFVPLFESVVVTFASSDPTRVEASESVSVTTLGQSVPGPLLLARTTTTVPVTVEARADALSLSASLAVSVVVPQVLIEQLDGRRSLGAIRDRFNVALRVAATDAGTQWLPESLQAQLSIIDASPEGLVPGIFASPEGGSAIAQVQLDAGGVASRSAYVGVPSAAGSYRVRAVVPGFGSIDSDLQQVVVPQLAISRASGAVAVGMRTRPGYLAVTRRIGEDAAFVDAPLTVQVEVSDSSKASIPASVTIPAGQWSADFQVDGVAAGAENVTIRATAPGHETGDVLQLQVVQPTLVLSGLDDRRSLGGPRDWFQIMATTNLPDAIPSGFISPRPIALSLSSPNPTDVVTGFFDRFSSVGGSPVNEVTIPAGESGVSAHVGEGQKVGTYRVRAESIGAITAESAEQRVSSTEIRFNLAEAQVGVGMDSTYYLYIERRRDGQLVNAVTPTVVSLTNPRTDALTVPATVTIPANASRMEIPLRGVSAAMNIQLAATGLGSTASTAVSVVIPTIKIRSLDGSRALSSGPDYFNVDVSVGDGGWFGYQTLLSPLTLDVDLVERSPTNVVAGVFADEAQTTPLTQVVIPAGQTNSSGMYVGAPAAVGTYRIRLGAPGLATAQSDTQSVAAARIAFGNAWSYYQPIGRGMQKQLWVQFAVGDGETFYNDRDVVVRLECVNPTVCGVEEEIVVPATCQSECTVGAPVYVRGLQVGSTQLRATAQGMEPAELQIEVRAPKVEIINLQESIAASDSPADFYVNICLFGDRAYGEEEVCFDEQDRAVDFTLDVVSSAPGYVDVVTPVTPGKITLPATFGYYWSDPIQLQLPSPRVPIRATITVSGPGVLPDSQDVVVE